MVDLYVMNIFSPEQHFFQAKLCKPHFFETKCCSRLNSFLSIYFRLEVKCICVASTLQVKSKVERQKIFWVNATNEHLGLGTALNFLHVILIYELISPEAGSDKWGTPRTTRFHFHYLLFFLPIHLIVVIFWITNGKYSTTFVLAVAGQGKLWSNVIMLLSYTYVSNVKRKLPVAQPVMVYFTMVYIISFE